MGERRRISISSQIRGMHWVDLDDYPPGTPLPEPPPLDASGLTPVWRSLISRGHRKGRRELMARAEAARDDYWRRKTTKGEDDAPDA